MEKSIGLIQSLNQINKIINIIIKRMIMFFILENKDSKGGTKDVFNFFF